MIIPPECGVENGHQSGVQDINYDPRSKLEPSNYSNTLLVVM